MEPPFKFFLDNLPILFVHSFIDSITFLLLEPAFLYKTLFRREELTILCPGSEVELG